MGLEVLSSSELSALNYNGLNEEEMFDQKEQYRLYRTGTVFSKSIDTLELPHPHDRFPIAKISPLQDLELLNRAMQVANDNGIAPFAPAPLENDQDLMEQMFDTLAESNDTLSNPEIPLADEVHALFTNGESDADKRSFLLQVNQLVAEILHLLTQLSDRDRKKTNSEKGDCSNLTIKQANATINQGTATAGLAILSFVVHGLSTVFLGEMGGKIGGALAQQIPSIGAYWTSELQANIAKYGNKISLLQTELQSTVNKSGDNSSWKQELIQSLDAIKEWLRSSVRSNG